MNEWNVNEVEKRRLLDFFIEEERVHDHAMSSNAKLESIMGLTFPFQLIQVTLLATNFDAQSSLP